MTIDRAAWAINWICVAMMFAGLVLVSQQIAAVRAEQHVVWRESAQDRADLRAEIMALKAIPPKVLEQVLAMRAEHKHMMELIGAEARSAWHAEQHMKHATGAKQ